MLGFQRLDVYRCAVQFLALFYRIARGSALECVAIVDAMEALGFVTSGEVGEGRGLLERVVAMLTKLKQ